MGRVISAVLVANLALTLLLFFWSVAASIAPGGEVPIWISFLVIAYTFKASVSLIAITILPFSFALAILGWRLGSQSRLWAILCGTILGFRLGVLLAEAPKGYETIPIYTIAGAVCGWIYWRIAIGRTPDHGRAIAEP